jgi:zinc transport system permease protein
MFFFEMFQFSFMIRAMIAGLAVAAIAPMIGSYLVMRRYSLIADTLAHVSLVGIAIGVITAQSPLIWSLLVAIVAALIIEWLRSSHRISGDALLATILSGSLAVAVLLISLYSSASNVNLMGFLFGSITSATTTDVIATGVLSVFIGSVFLLLRKELILASYDAEYARASGLRVRLLNIFLIVCAAVTVSLAIRVVGVLLISAMMIVPVMAAMRLSTSFWQVQTQATVFALLGVVVGLTLSFYIDLPTGATIVLFLIGVFGLSLLLSRR